ncbi:GntR family transcriptional regulator [Brucella pituitosa]|uniref:GntR family transcriptional regulator n=1 Tax=Brucella pituitosa TaxID=571256 RepID=UPI0013747968|nr:GntR family transcriptional regulator [Brucella pituitosa]
MWPSLDICAVADSEIAAADQWKDIVMRGAAPRLYQSARDRLALDIANGGLSEGQRLSETWVAEHFGISRAPARQALVELAARGLLAKEEGRRGYVVSARAGETGFDADATVAKRGPIQFLASWQRIYSEIEREIFARSSIASWRVNELALARHYDVSRTVARDVVARLQQRGIIDKAEGGRWLAPALTDKRLHDLFELRWVLEPLALEKALPRLPEGLLGRLRGNLDAATRAGQVSAATLDALEQELHVELLGYCDNQALLQAVRLPQTLLVAHHFLYQWTSQLFATEPFLPEHLAIVAALQSGNLKGAQAALIDHLKISHARAMLRVQTIAGTIEPYDLPYLERQDG